MNAEKLKQLEAQVRIGGKVNVLFITAAKEVMFCRFLFVCSSVCFVCVSHR